jgi:large subunit ribosomal protein L9|nr:50S ribosomal protein L9 [uncultured Prevotella sp.]
MEVILKEDIIGLGYKNDIVKVKDGYGRNYLIPKKKAVIASVSARKQLAEDLKQQADKIAALKAEAEKKAEALKDVSLKIIVKVGPTGVTYGSVNVATVADELSKKGFDIDRKIITMHDIKKVGDYEATIHFFKDVEFKLPVEVAAEENEAAKAAPKKKSTEAPKAEKAEKAEPAAKEEKPEAAESQEAEKEEAPAAE